MVLPAAIVRLAATDTIREQVKRMVQPIPAPAPSPLPGGAPAAAEPPPPVVTPEPGTELERLLSQRELAQAQVQEAEDSLKSINDGIKRELTTAFQGTRVIIIRGSQHWPTLRLRWVTPRRVNSDRLKSEQPALVDAYREWGTPYWDLRATGGN
jgi:hypothetical protein